MGVMQALLVYLTVLLMILINSSEYVIRHEAVLAQLVERVGFNHVVVGSSPMASRPSNS